MFLVASRTCVDLNGQLGLSCTKGPLGPESNSSVVESCFCREDLCNDNIVNAAAFVQRISMPLVFMAMVLVYGLS